MILENLFLTIFTYIVLVSFFRKNSSNIKIGILINTVFLLILYKYIFHAEINFNTLISISIGIIMTFIHKIFDLDKYISLKTKK